VQGVEPRAECDARSVPPVTSLHYSIYGLKDACERSHGGTRAWPNTSLVEITSDTT
jgi:hypothetical protein